ncbi:peptide/nickel transport system permease protein [Friedmanniella endophytica]|uniref:Peptide/nickel transport system permease protein n=1 Tax=Microlunatus kandeliicorticis TaxID=1759536 RepID=A0A7W3IUE4_9ACTN|nr:ABC transporter permease [Microlunatus kandeliicorticis]MBA8795365.1 peptide/nickel transport system permease protein [Microlunatus kandeliicorticis]
MADAIAALGGTVPGAPADAGAARSRGQGVFAQLTRSPSGFAGLILVVLIVGMSVLGPLVVSPPVSDVNLAWNGPSGAHWLGTNGSGQDVLKLIVRGGQVVIFVGFGAAALTTVIAVAIGALAAYFRGRFDAIMLQITDIVMTVPQIVLLAVMGAFFQLDSPVALAALLGFLTWPVLMRSIRAQVLSLKEREFVEAARLLNLGTWRIVFVEIVPNMASYILINFIIAVTNAIYALAGLYLLGLAPMSGSNWGIMINDAWTSGAMFNPLAVLYILAPVAMIVLLNLGLIMLSRSLEEIINPRLRDS